MNALLATGLLTVAGLALARIARIAGLPSVTGYLVAGIVVGPWGLGIIAPSMAESMAGLLETVVLGFIAFGIGREFRWDRLRQVGAGILLVTVVQGIAATVSVTAGLALVGYSLPLAMILGGVATATAPAATIMVVKEYNASGPLTSTLLQVVALDDALGVMVFGVLVSLARALTQGGPASLASAVAKPAIEIVGSLLLGGVLGVLLAVVVNKIGRPSNHKIWAIGSVLIAIGLADTLGWSPLLVNMGFGTVFVNSTGSAEHIAEQVDDAISPLYVSFFAVAGASLNILMLPRLGLLGFSYLILRSLGKIGGAWAGAKWASLPKSVQDNLGIALLPQAGVAIGMVAVARRSVPQVSDAVTAVVLGSVIVHEILGPILARRALFRSGETQPGS
ncbi:MAG: cation:proton antiporter [Ignavibacteriales bacterium]